MAMNKKEAAQLSEAIENAEVNRALRWSDGEIQADVRPPKSSFDGMPYTRGWIARFWCSLECPSRYIGKGISSCISHGSNWDKTDTQQPIAMFSTRLRALRALRRMAENKFAAFLASIDAEIKREIAEPTPNWADSHTARDGK